MLWLLIGLSGAAPGDYIATRPFSSRPWAKPHTARCAGSDAELLCSPALRPLVHSTISAVRFSYAGKRSLALLVAHLGADRVWGSRDVNLGLNRVQLHLGQHAPIPIKFLREAASIAMAPSGDPVLWRRETGRGAVCLLLRGIVPTLTFSTLSETLTAGQADLHRRCPICVWGQPRGWVLRPGGER